MPFSIDRLFAAKLSVCESELAAGEAQIHALPFHCATCPAEQFSPARTSVFIEARLMVFPPVIVRSVPTRETDWLSVFMGARSMLLPPEIVNTIAWRLRA